MRFNVYLAPYANENIYVSEFAVGAKGWHEDYDLNIIEELEVTAVIEMKHQGDGIQTTIDKYLDDRLNEDGAAIFDICGEFSLNGKDILVLFNQLDVIDELPPFDNVINC